MLFILADSLAAYDFSENTPGHIVLGLQRLLQAHYDGNHVVVIQRDTCLRIEASSLFSVREKATAQKIRIRYTEYGGLINTFPTYSSVREAGVAPVKERGVWSVPIRWIADRPLDKSALICEDLYDADILEGAAKDFIFEKSLHSFDINVTKANGGGANTHKAFWNLAIGDQKISLCVVDSDKVSPNAAIGSVAKNCVDIAGDGLFEVKLTLGRSLENSLPWRLINNIPQHQPAVLELRRLGNASAEAVKFLDFKRGLYGHDIKEMDDQCSAFWTGVGTNHAAAPTCCPSAKQCVKDGRGDCSYRVHLGFGRPLLGTISTWFASTTSRERLPLYIPSENIAEWGELGKTVACYGISVPRTRL